jgi:hypothetical protein
LVKIVRKSTKRGTEKQRSRGRILDEKGKRGIRKVK